MEVSLPPLPFAHHLYIKDLPPLCDITNELVFDETPPLFELTHHADEFMETALHLMDEMVQQHPHWIAEPHFKEMVMDELRELFHLQMESSFQENAEWEDDLDEHLEEVFEIFTILFYPERSGLHQNDGHNHDRVIVIHTYDDPTEHDISFHSHAHTPSQPNMEELSQKIAYLRTIPQPPQRTNEWYEYRWNLITASNAWKAFESPSVQNQLIYEKCQPLKQCMDIEGTDGFKDIKLTNTTTTLHWGQKYEPLSIMIYEHLYHSKVEEFGCIRHPNPEYYFIGASPDGIVVESSTGRYGRVLEIKNVVNRLINGKPKKEYWVQMQLQMEVCDLDLCDFLETKFVEYDLFQQFVDESAETTEVDENGDTHLIPLYNKTKDGQFKGIIIQFFTKDGTPHYEYMPLHLKTPEEVKEWEEQTVHTYENGPHGYTFIKYIYWKLDTFSCVKVERNREWFQGAIKKLREIWTIIEKERVSGYEHRAPAKRTKKEPVLGGGEQTHDTCFMRVIKIDTATDDHPLQLNGKDDPNTTTMIIST